MQNYKQCLLFFTCAHVNNNTIERYKALYVYNNHTKRWVWLINSDFNCTMQLFQFTCHNGEPLLVKSVVELVIVTSSVLENLKQSTLSDEIQLPGLQRSGGEGQ